MKPASVKQLSPESLDFAPGLLAIQESPPARLPRTVLYTVVTLFAILLLWAVFGQLDVVASAEGKLVPQTYVKIVQPAEAGIVQEILVREGEAVKPGQVLMRMDASPTEADARAIHGDYQMKALQLRRIDSELAGQPLRATAADDPVLFAQVSQQQAARRQNHLDALSQEQANRDKTRHDLQAAEEVLHKLRDTVPSYRRSAAAYERLGKEGFQFRLVGRVKSPWSIYTKMRAEGKTFDQVMDVFGFRLVVRTVPECYHALGVVHSVFKPLDGRFRDFVAIPKANGYQSLHTVLFGPSDRKSVV